MDFKGKISTDTRLVGRGDVFFALKGERFDGHDFIGEALAKGAETIVYSDESKAATLRDRPAKWIRVEDTLYAYGDWAKAALARWRSCPCLSDSQVPAGRKVVAVTGSSGKTTVKEMLAQVLGVQFTVHKNVGTENNLVGVPKTIFGLEERHTILVLELGTNFPGEIGRLSEISSPDVAAITLVGASHLEGLGSIEGVRREKLSIRSGLRPGGVLWVNGDDPMLASVPDARFALIDGAPACRQAGAELRAENIQTGAEETFFRVGVSDFKLNCLGRHNVLNALLVIGIARGLGMKDEKIASALENFRPVAGRLQVRRIEGFTFLDDTYNANPVSFEAALGVLANFSVKGRKIAVTGDMLELGPESEAFHRALGRRVAERGIDCLITAGERSRATADEAVKAGLDAANVCACRDSVQAGETLRAIHRASDVALIKGSRGMKMEKVFDCFLPSFTR